jgi:hypothetical protein
MPVETAPTVVMPGLDPGIHVAIARTMDCRVKPGNDSKGARQ